MSDEPKDGSLPSYPLRTITWPNGVVETGREIEKRLHKIGLRERWHVRRQEIQKELRGAGEECSYDDAAMIAFKEFPPGEGTPTLIERQGIAPEDAAFVAACRHELAHGRHPQLSAWDKEAAWIVANLEKDVPNVANAPSKSALTTILNCRVSKSIREKFFAQWFSKRMTPGDKKPKEKVLVADVEEEGIDEHEDLMGRLFQGVEKDSQEPE